MTSRFDATTTTTCGYCGVACRLEALLETLELGSLCAHGGGMPAPIRSLIAHWPEELGVAPPPPPPTLHRDEGLRRPEEPS